MMVSLPSNTTKTARGKYAIQMESWPPEQQSSTSGFCPLWRSDNTFIGVKYQITYQTFMIPNSSKTTVAISKKIILWLGSPQ